MLKIIIPTTPRSKKNSQQIIYNKKMGRMMVVQNKRYTEFEKECKNYIPKLDKPINYPVNLQCKFFVADARKRDIVNFLEAIQDVLVKYKVFEDDDYSIVASIDGCSMEIDREYPHIEIYIEKKQKEPGE